MTKIRIYYHPAVGDEVSLRHVCKEFTSLEDAKTFARIVDEVGLPVVVEVLDEAGQSIAFYSNLNSPRHKPLGEFIEPLERGGVDEANNPNIAAE